MSGLKNKLIDLNNHLFVQLERLNDDELAGEQLAEEVRRAKAIGGIAKDITDCARLVFDAQRHFNGDNAPQGATPHRILSVGSGD